jgi:hypothetical protein
VKDDCWKVAFLEKSNLREVYFFCEVDPGEKELEEILKYPQVGKDKEFSFRQALLRIGTPKIPNKFRLQKKLLRRITDDPDVEEHF